MSWAFVLLGVALAAVTAACSDRTDLPPSATAAPAGGSPTTPPPADAIERVQAVIQKAGGYRIAVTASNFVLTQWGGSDGGTVEVDESSGRVRAELQRTGEGGPYTIIRADGQTVFRRATCDQWARIPGGGVGVLEPFLFSKTLAKVSTPSVSQDARGLVIGGKVEQLGDVTHHHRRPCDAPPTPARRAASRGAACDVGVF